MSLFRKEAVEHQKDRLMGDVILLQPLSFAVLTIIALVIAGMIIGMLFWGTYARKETVRGYLVPDKGVVKVFAPSTGTVTDIFVKDGEYVEAGQTLFRMSLERSNQSGQDIDGLIIEEIERELADIDKRIQDERDIEQAELKRLQTQLEGLKEELAQIEESLSIHEKRVALSKERLEANRKLLEKKLLSQKDFDKIEEEHLSLLQQQQELLRSRITKRNNITEVESQLVSYPLQVKSKISALEKERSDLKQRLYEVEGRHIFEVKAPVSGYVDGLTVTPGQWVGNQGANLVAIIPTDSVMKAELYVPSRAIGFIEQGQKVRMRYDAFPHQRYGVYEGTVESISAHIMHPQELNIPHDIQEPVYKVVIALDAQSVKAYGKEMPLQAGMSLEADIIIDRQSLLDWIFDPIYSIKGKL